MAKKRYKHVFESIVNKAKILVAKNEVIRSIKNSRADKNLKQKRLKDFENEDYIINGVWEKLNNINEYFPKPYNTFVTVENGKERKIEYSSDPFDKVIHKLVAIKLKEILEPRLFYYSLCNVKYRGISLGEKRICNVIKREDRLKHFKSLVGKNYKRATSNCAKCDIYHYYESIDRDILRAKLEKIILDKTFLDLIFKFINNYKTGGLGIGGGMCSILANFYLEDVDNFILHSIKKKPGPDKGKKLRGGYYLRYMDDIVIFGTSKEKLHNILKELREVILPSLKLKMKGNYYVAPFYPKKDGGDLDKVRRLDFLGYTFNPRNVHIRKRTKFRIIKLLRLASKKKLEHTPTKVLRSLMSYWGYIKNSNSYYLIRKYFYKRTDFVKSVREELRERRKRRHRKISQITKFVNYCSGILNRIFAKKQDMLTFS